MNRIATLLVLAVVLSGTASVVAAESSTTPDDVCGSTASETVVGVLPTGEPLTGEASVYAGSTLDVVLCRSGDAVTTEGNAWALAATKGLSVEENPKSYTVTVTGGKSQVNLAEQVTGTDVSNGLVLTVTSGVTVDLRVMHVDSITFPSSDAANDFRRTHAAYVAADRSLGENASRLAAVTDRLRNGSTVDVNRTVVADLATAAQTQDRHEGAMRTYLYAAAWGGDADALTALEELEQGTENRSKANERLLAYRDALRSERRSILSSILVDLGLGLLPGLVVGLIAGAWYPHRKGKEVAYDRKYSVVPYSWQVVLGPVLAGVVAVGATVAVLAILGWAQKIMVIVL